MSAVSKSSENKRSGIDTAPDEASPRSARISGVGVGSWCWRRDSRGIGSVESDQLSQINAGIDSQSRATACLRGISGTWGRAETDSGLEASRDIGPRYITSSTLQRSVSIALLWSSIRTIADACGNRCYKRSIGDEAIAIVTSAVLVATDTSAQR